MADLEALENWVSPLLQRIEPAERSKLARQVAQQLRRSQQKRITAQQNPDGSAYAPRKPRQLRGKQGRIRAKVKMFQKLRTATFMKARGDASAVTVGFTGRIARIARVHQEGLRDRVARGAPTVEYAQREVLGFTDAELDQVRDTLLAHLTL